MEFTKGEDWRLDIGDGGVNCDYDCVIFYCVG